MATTHSDHGPAQPSGLYEEGILGARDVCSNCHRLIRVERIDPTRNGWGDELDSHYERRRQTTEVGYGPSEAMSESKGTFCACGVESARERLWHGGDLDRERFKTLLKHTVRTLEHKDVTLRRKETLAYALSHFDDHGDPDQALATAIDAGVLAAAATPSQTPSTR